MTKDTASPNLNVYPVGEQIAYNDGMDRLHETHPALFTSWGVEPANVPMLRRSYIESRRGSNSADEKAKNRFFEALLNEMKGRQLIDSWQDLSAEKRCDYEAVLNDENHTRVAIELKGALDGANAVDMWDRPDGYDEFIIWSQFPNALSKSPGYNIASYVSRVLNRMMVGEVDIDAVIVYDGRNGSDLRPSPKLHGIYGNYDSEGRTLRERATDIPTQSAQTTRELFPELAARLGNELLFRREREGWMPPPCSYLMPRPRIVAEETTFEPQRSKFADAVMTLFNIPADELAANQHRVSVDVRPNDLSDRGASKRPRIVSVGWEDGEEGLWQGSWARVRR